MYQKNKKKQSSIFRTLPVTVEIKKNHSLLKFFGPCGQSSLLRKKIDEKGYLLLHFEKKNIYHRNLDLQLSPYFSIIDIVKKKKVWSQLRCRGLLTEKTFLLEGGAHQQPNLLKIVDIKKSNNPLSKPFTELVFPKGEFVSYQENKAAVFSAQSFFPKTDKKYTNNSILKWLKNNILITNKIKNCEYGQPRTSKEKLGTEQLETKKTTNKKVPLHSRRISHSILNKFLVNKILGVENGYSVFLQLIGLGYRFSLQLTDLFGNKIGNKFQKSYTHFLGQKIGISQKAEQINSFYAPGEGGESSVVKKQTILNISAGFSHKIKYIFPQDLSVFMVKSPRNKICLFGIDKDDVYSSAWQIYQVQPPSRYKGKGCRINNVIPKVHTGKKNK